jgi:methyltransferase (TIGR00027 family)
MESRRTHEDPVLADVSDTARWVAYLRALESERHDALFHDALARRLAGERGRAIAETMPKGPLPWSLAVRTRVFDDLILEAVRAHEVDAVVNLGAGLDARPYRLPLPANLRWLELDLPALVAWKDRALADERAACPVERIAIDLADRDKRQEVLARLAGEAPRALIVTEGLLVYLDEPTVAALATDLHRFFPEGLWLLENAAPATLARQRRRWGKALRAADAEHKFAPREGLAFFRPRGWVPRSTRSLLDEAQRLRRELPIVALLRRVSPWLPFIERAYARRHDRLRDAMLYAIMEATTSRS